MSNIGGPRGGEMNIVSISGGKDSTAMALLAIDRKTKNLRFVFADTGHEHQQTYDYVAYLDEQLTKLCGVGIERVKADFSDRIAHKRETVQTKWRNDGISEEKIQRALAALQPTGIPFLDLCLWKGRFPSTRVRFCSQELKHVPLDKYSQTLWAAGHNTIISWQGVRRDESSARRDLLEKDVDLGTWEPEPKGLLIYRPILDWKAEDCFDMHRKFGIKWNPLYEQGMRRVGCMPCIHTGKAEMREIARRFPDEIKRVAEWEALVTEASKRDAPTFMTANFLFKLEHYRDPTKEDISMINCDNYGINAYVDWAHTAHGGRQLDLINVLDITDVPQCSSQYGLCE